MDTQARDDIDDLKAENERLRNSMRIIRNELAALVPVPSADDPEWPEYLNDADYECLTLALREARTALSKAEGAGEK